MDYLYNLTYCQILLIARGYYARKRTGWEQARLVAYCSTFAFGSKNTPPTISEWLPLSWEKSDVKLLSDDEVEAIRDMIIAENRKKGD